MARLLWSDTFDNGKSLYSEFGRTNEDQSSTDYYGFLSGNNGLEAPKKVTAQLGRAANHLHDQGLLAALEDDTNILVTDWDYAVSVNGRE